MSKLCVPTILKVSDVGLITDLSMKKEPRKAKKLTNNKHLEAFKINF
jgi:hypothetical protein